MTAYSSNDYYPLGGESGHYSIVECNSCGFQIRKSGATVDEIITIWNLLSLSPVPSVGDVFKVDGITYKVLTTSTLQVGDETNAAISPEKASCAIPETVTYGGTSYTVTSIGRSAFAFCSYLTSVTFPASLTSLGDHVFFYCTSLQSISLPDSLTTIGDSAFYNCSGLTSVTFPSSLTSIRDSAFSYCSALTSVKFPASLTSIGDSAFYGSGLTSVTLPASLTSIGESAFDECWGLTGIRYLGMVEPSIVDDTFSEGPSVRILYVPNATGGFTAEKWGAAKVVYGAVGGAGSGEEGKFSRGWGWHIDATDMYDKTCPECGDEDGMKIEAGIGPYYMCATKCKSCGYESAACSVYPDTDGAEKEALEGWGDQDSDEETKG
jgi:ribosomal protein L37AE/L43A